MIAALGLSPSEADEHAIDAWIAATATLCARHSDLGRWKLSAPPAKRKQSAPLSTEAERRRDAVAAFKKVQRTPEAGVVEQVVIDMADGVHAEVALARQLTPSIVQQWPGYEDLIAEKVVPLQEEVACRDDLILGLEMVNARQDQLLSQQKVQIRELKSELLEAQSLQIQIKDLQWAYEYETSKTWSEDCLNTRAFPHIIAELQAVAQECDEYRLLADEYRDARDTFHHHFMVAESRFRDAERDLHFCRLMMEADRVTHEQAPITVPQHDRRRDKHSHLRRVWRWARAHL